MATKGKRFKALSEFFKSSFSRTELHEFLDLNGFEEVASAVNREDAPSKYFYDVVNAMDQRGMIDDAFFEFLREARPRKGAKIEDLKRAWPTESQGCMEPAGGASSTTPPGAAPASPATPQHQPSDRPTVVARTSLPLPPTVYAVPEYTLTNVFIGRSSELDQLDSWAKSSDAIMVVEGIGGLGKSAVTWEWMQRRAPAAIPNLAGRIWWSFYEKGTSMVTFVRHALAYVTGQDPESLTKDSSHYQRSQQLLTELRRRPFLLVLDGFERVLTAYHRLDKAQIPDDRVESDLRDCINPPDGELLSQLLGCGPSSLDSRWVSLPFTHSTQTTHIPGVGRCVQERTQCSFRSEAIFEAEAVDCHRRVGSTIIVGEVRVAKGKGVGR